MGVLDWITLGNGKARFVGLQLGADEEPHEVLAVELGEDGVYFGEFAAVYEPDGNHYGVEIISFGYNSKHNIGNHHPGARAAFSASEVGAIRDLILALILSAADKPYPLKRRDLFRGGISFHNGWIVMK
ncbi:hypothetical protein FJ934_21795 [Mesorhizobium sp. B2-4-12]|uniref:hypothetical protein n=1 Tax=Mesorhizobium sp. B2-4-12 TaxID=2589937 RepID=UPI0011299C31|nr:hypothetical protein [Mesorhizobium sp. B2-4-12]TPK91633.1 hypothetical protein FJ934_21795 [Mesorhizobium sp. B2-4-12]